MWTGLELHDLEQVHVGNSGLSEIDCYLKWEVSK